MKYYILRNSTVEHLFSRFDVTYSGYGDISNVESGFDAYIWFYVLPFHPEMPMLKSEVDTYYYRLQLVLQSIGTDKPCYVFSLLDLFQVTRNDSDYSLKEAINKFDTDVYELSKQHSNVKLIDWSDFLFSYPINEWIDWKFYFISQIQLNPRFSQSFQDWFSHKLDQIQFKRKKCLVLDLDNTLWGGVLGEDGINGIKIGGDYPGNAFLFFQQSLIELSKDGVILAICSKNNESDVLELWDKNPFVQLKRKYFSVCKINWRNKADNIEDIAKELNIGLDSIVFIDDNPAERELVNQLLPMVETPDFPAHAHELAAFYKSIVDKYFRVYSLTEEDRRKTEQYNANAQRKMAQNQYANFADYLESLKIEVEVSEANDFNISRISQMTQKTNQFNLTTHRYTEADIKHLLSLGWKIYCLSVRDRFGDNGITGCVFLNIAGKEITIDTFLLSCRILGKEIESGFMHYILADLKQQGYKKVLAEYIETAKNSQVADFYDKIGFVLTSLDNGHKKYCLDLSDLQIPEMSYCKIYNS